jgi:hypothetical protein
MFNNGNQGSQSRHPGNQPNQNGGSRYNQQHGQSNIANRNGGYQGPEYNQEKGGGNGYGQNKHQEWTSETQNHGKSTRTKRQEVSQIQKQLVDQNFANNVVFMGMSVVEEIFNKFK